MKIISVINHKGGVGKTTTTANLGAALANSGYRVLLIDLDGQQNLSQAYGLQDQEPNIYKAMIGVIPSLPIKKVNDNLSVVPSSLDLSASEISLLNEPGRERILFGLLEPHSENYDFVIIDCPPAIGVLTLNALTASDGTIIPVEAEAFAVKGLKTLQDIIQKVRLRLNPKIEELGILLTKYNSSRKLTSRLSERMREGYRVFDTVIRTNVSLAEAQLQGVDIFRYDPRCNGAIDYANFALEISKLIGNG